MKVLFDPIHTSEPHKCAGNYKMQEICRYLSLRDDIYMYYLLPETPKGDAVNWGVDESKLFQHPRLKYSYIPTARDRVREFLAPHPAWTGAMLFNGTHWDADVIVTGRMVQAPMIQVLRGGMKTGINRLKRFRVLGTENYPMIPNKGMVPHYEQMCDNLVYGHQSFDAAYVFIDYFRDIILKRGRDMFSPAKMAKLAKAVQCVQPAHIDTFHVKTPEEIERLHHGDEPFTIAYTQRMDVVRRRTDDVFESMKRHWIFNSTDKKPVRCIVSSISKADGRAKLRFTADGFERVTKTRPEYLEMLKKEVHAVVVLSSEEGHSFTTIEPLLNGVPVVLWRRPWSESLVGKDYPFFVDGRDIVKEAYALLRRMYLDYSATYKVLHQWLTDSYWPLIRERNKNWLGVAVERQIDSLAEEIQSAYTHGLTEPTGMTEALLPMLFRYGTEPFRLGDVVHKAYKEERIRYDHEKRMSERAWLNSSTGSFSQGLYMNKTRHDLMFVHGYKDAGCDVGVLSK